ncbi:hypothetical protein DFH29DRAFT_940858 [Suillus ampliporus]|nr:hypothetical protein DFH29DRAFT_940858 [Suillus ampliporus]
MSLTCAMILLSGAILLYSPPRCSANKSAPKGCPRRTSILNSRVCDSESACSLSPRDLLSDSSDGDSGSDHSSRLCASSARSSSSRS